MHLLGARAKKFLFRPKKYLITHFVTCQVSFVTGILNLVPEIYFTFNFFIFTSLTSAGWTFKR